MHHIIQELEKVKSKKIVPEIGPGFTVRVHQKIKEGKKERIQIFEGLVIDAHGGKGARAAIKVRKVSAGIGVEKTFLIHSPFIVKIEVIKQATVRRAKLFYVRRADQDKRLKNDRKGLEKTQKEVADLEDKAAKAKAKAESEKKAADSAKKAAEEKAKADEKAATEKKEAETKAKTDSDKKETEKPKAEAK